MVISLPGFAATLQFEVNEYSVAKGSKIRDLPLL